MTNPEAFDPSHPELQEDVVFSDELPAYSQKENRSKQDLLVPAGTTKRIFPRTYSYRNIIVEHGARLIVAPRSRKWLVLRAEQSVRIHGQLVYRRLFDSPEPITETASDGTELIRPFNPSMRGGNGGKGGRHSAVNQSAEGGPGGAGTRLAGGGGGGGAYYQFGMHKGGSASSDQGGYPFKRGGNGGIQSRFCHGGLVYISAGDQLDVDQGYIDLRGEGGEAGGAGENGYNPPGQYGAAGGGGAGGAPGGDGGILLVRATEVYFDPENAGLSGGLGGRPGSAGAYNGRPGYSGTSGVNGFVDFLP